MRPQAPAPRRLLALGTAVALVVLLGACGGGPGSDAPDDADVEDFCANYAQLYEVEDGDDVRQWSEDMAAVGTPSDIDDAARDGFELLVDEAADGTDPDLSEEAERSRDAFAGYQLDTCSGVDVG